MSATPTTQNSRFDTIKWIFVLALVAAGVVGNSIYSDQSLLYRTLALVALAAVALFVALQTAKGRGYACLLYTSPSPRDRTRSRMPSSA